MNDKWRPISEADLYEWEDNRLFVNGEYRAVLESKTDDDGICHHVAELCNEAEEGFRTGYELGYSNAVNTMQWNLNNLKLSEND